MAPIRVSYSEYLCSRSAHPAVMHQSRTLGIVPPMAADLTAKQILEALRPLGTAGYKKVLLNHGIPDSCTA